MSWDAPTFDPSTAFRAAAASNFDPYYNVWFEMRQSQHSTKTYLGHERVLFMSLLKLDEPVELAVLLKGFL